MKTLTPFAVLVCTALSWVAVSAALAEQIDTIAFGDAKSEAAHALQAEHSETITGGLGVPARRLLPNGEGNRIGGQLTFDVKVDPDEPTYVTTKFWGGDADEAGGRLVLYIDGKQVGQRHLGDVDILDILGKEPRYPGRFTYKTLPLPRSTTAGKEKVTLKIEANGPIWAYGETWDKFQKPLTTPTRGIYAVYTHTDPFFAPGDGETQGAPPDADRRRDQPGPEVLQKVRERVNSEVRKQMASGDEMRQVFIQFLAKAYHQPWTEAYRQKAVVEKVVRGIDSRYRVFEKNPDIIKSDRETWNHDWFGYGPTADAIRLLADELQPYLSENISGTDVPRCEGWADMLIASRDWHATTRRQYTNQSMIKDLYGIYLCNRGVTVVEPSKAWPEEKAKRYLYESVGLEPWRGSDGADGKPTFPLGEGYMQLTAKGLTKELGYVGNYGEVVDWVVAIYDATRPTPDAEGDAEIKAQLVKIARARGVFRYPNADADGFRTMQLETVIGWRDTSYPGGTVYDQRPSWDAGPLEAAAAALDPVLVGYAQQMLADNQFFKALDERSRDGGFRVTAGLLHAPGSYETINAQPAQEARLPMAKGQPDFVFADPEVGAVAIKHGEEILYASLYWRARFGVNQLARVHHLTSTMERDATVRQETVFRDSGMRYVRDDRVVEAQTERHEKNLPDVQLAEAGEELPIAMLPEGVKGFKPGKENVYAGKGDFYTLRYGPYLIAMNCTADQRFTLPLPRGESFVRLPEKQAVSGAGVEVGPGETLALYAQ